MTSPVHRRTQQAQEQNLADDQGHLRVESCHYVIDWNYNEDRSQIRAGFGSENITRLRRFAISLLKSKKSDETIPETGYALYSTDHAG